MAEKSSSSPTASADDIVMLEIDVKEPAKRSPISATGVYGASPSQYVIRHGDDAQEVRGSYNSRNPNDLFSVNELHKFIITKCHKKKEIEKENKKPHAKHARI